MKIDLSQREIAILDDALVAWQTQPQSEGFSASLMTAIFKGLAKRDGAELEPPDEPKLAMKEAMAESKTRERQALLLRAKLSQASALSSEHEVEVSAPPTP